MGGEIIGGGKKSDYGVMFGGDCVMVGGAMSEQYWDSELLLQNID